MEAILFVLLLFMLTTYAVQSRNLPYAFKRISEFQNNDQTFDVVDFGAKGDGHTVDSQAFRDAWEATCKSSSSSPTMLIPHQKTFLLRPLIFKGPCKSNYVHVEIQGNIVAPSERSEWQCDRKSCSQLLAFLEVDGLYINGGDDVTIDARGSSWWKLSCDVGKNGCGSLPTTLVIGHCNNVQISRLSILNSPQMHVALESSTWIHASNLTIKASKDSHNTDGIHIQKSENVFIENTRIGTGDDCISIGDGSAHLDISKIICGPGHGISIGSLGKKGHEEKVEDIHVSDVQFWETTNGVRIKTWQGGRGYARNIVFERIQFHDTANPIIIDQYYCDSHHQCKNQTSAVKISNVTYSEVYGTTKKKTAVKLACSETVPCEDIIINNISITSTEKSNQPSSYCLNAHGRLQGEVDPMVSCLDRT